MNKRQTAYFLQRADIATSTEYFSETLDSWHNGQIEQAKEMFTNMPKKYKKSFLIWILRTEEHDVIRFFICQL